MARASWRELIDIIPSAEREFLALSVGTQAEFIRAFDELSRHPTRPSPTLDVAPLRDRAGRWRLRVPGGDRGIYVLSAGRPKFEMFETREEVYERLRRYLISRTKERP